MVIRDYSKYSREDLIAEIEKLKKSRYGIVWEKELTKEKFEKESEGKYPIVKELKSKSVSTKNSKLTHILIEGDNFHSLTVLNYTHPKSFDLISIDPPYNTGKKDFKYNDQWVDTEDSYKHSKWLSFMNKRLKLAKSLLSDDGVIFITIDDHEVAQLKLLCDKIFNENLISIVIWEKKHCLMISHWELYMIMS